MNKQNIQMFFSQNAKMFEQFRTQEIVQELQNADDEKLSVIISANYKDPTMMLIISIFVGGLGVDRFILGDTGMGVLKLLTGGCFGVLTIIDWFNIQKKAKEKNYDIFKEVLKMSDVTENIFSQISEQSQEENNSFEQIKRYKQLLDDGVITQEEFDVKKKELL